jgi:tRNA threonylcarbamoyl adenosine modification protein YjeE
MNQIFTSNSIEETQEIALIILPLVLRSKIVVLSGDLGSGKTLMCGTIIKELCKNADLVTNSPTFNILKTYNSENLGLIHHYDLYRLKNPAEIEEIGLAEALRLRSSICLIEWPELIESILPSDSLHIEIQHIEDIRTITTIVK